MRSDCLILLEPMVDARLVHEEIVQRLHKVALRVARLLEKRSDLRWLRLL